MLANLISLSFVFSVSFSALASTAEIQWPSRNSKVVCGGMADGQELEISQVPTTQFMKAESSDFRVLIYLDFSRVGRARILIAEVLTDEDYEAREAILSKLPAEEAELLRRLSKNHFSESYIGFTDQYFHLRTSFGNKSISLSCQEVSKD